MMRTMLKCKIHRATVTEAVLHYEGSITIDETLMEAAGLIEYEQVHIYNIDNGNRFSTYATYDEKELANFRPTLVYVDAKNRITSVKRKVESGNQVPRVAAAR